MADLPARPSLDHLRREARDLLRAAQSGDTAAADRIRAVSAAPTLASAQLAVAREYGFASWARLKTAVAGPHHRPGPAGRDVLRGQHPRLDRARGPDAGRHPGAGRLQLRHRGDPGRRRPRARRDRPRPRPGHPRRRPNRLDSAARGLRLALAPARPGPGRRSAGRGPAAAGRRRRPRRPRRRAARQRGGWTPLRCAVAGSANPPVVALLLERGAVPDDHDLYLAGFGGDDHESLRLLLEPRHRRGRDARQAARRAAQPRRHRGGAAAAGGRSRSPPLRRRRRRARLGGLRSRPVRLFGRTGRAAARPRRRARPPRP